MHADGKSTLTSVSKWNSGTLIRICQGENFKAVKRLIEKCLVKCHCMLLVIITTVWKQNHSWTVLKIYSQNSVLAIVTIIGRPDVTLYSFLTFPVQERLE